MLEEDEKKSLQLHLFSPLFAARLQKHQTDALLDFPRASGETETKRCKREELKDEWKLLH